MQRPGHDVEPSVFKELRKVKCCGSVESKEESGLKATEQVSGFGTYRPYKPHGRVGT